MLEVGFSRASRMNVGRSQISMLVSRFMSVRLPRVRLDGSNVGMVFVHSDAGQCESVSIPLTCLRHYSFTRTEAGLL